MQVVILAGGLATRMHGGFPGIPKILIPVGGRPFLDLQLENLVRRGAGSVLLCVGHLGDQVRAHVEARPPPLPVAFSSEGPRLVGTGGALRASLAAGLLDERFIVGFGDSYLPADLRLLMAAHVREKSRATMTVFRNDDWRIRSNCVVGGGRVTWYDKSTPLAERPPNVRWIDYGLTVLERDFVASWTYDDPLDLSLAIGDAVSRGEVVGHEVFERFHEIGSLEGLAVLEEALSRGDPFAT